MATAIATVSSWLPANLINRHTNYKPPQIPISRFHLRPSSSSTFPADIASPNFLTNNKKQQQKKKRGWAVVTRAGPSTTSVVLAFVLPLALLLVTVLTSIRISDNLDQKFLEELAINEAIMNEENENGGEDALALTKEMTTPAPTRERNRPKREA